MWTPFVGYWRVKEEIKLHNNNKVGTQKREVKGK